MKISNHRLIGEDVRFEKSPNQGGRFIAGPPDSIVIHYTAGPSVESAVQAFSDPRRKVSAHVVVGRDGSMIQLVPFNRIAWHAGRSEYRGRVGFNNFSIGIEIGNAGRLEQTGDRYTSWFSGVYAAEEVIEAVHRNESRPTFWHRYTPEQIVVVQALCETLIERYGIAQIVGHEEISPGRKIDPGPAFPLDKLRQRLLSQERAEDGAPVSPPMAANSGLITASRLNIRSRPSLGATAVAPPLGQGTLVEIRQEVGGWYEVDIHTRGWVKAEYVKR